MEIDCDLNWPFPETLLDQLDLLERDCDWAAGPAKQTEALLDVAAHLQNLLASATLSGARTVLAKNPARSRALQQVVKDYIDESQERGWPLAVPTAAPSAPYTTALQAVLGRILEAAREADAHGHHLFADDPES